MELIHKVAEAESSIPPSDWKARKAGGIVQRPESQRANGVDSRLSWRLENQKQQAQEKSNGLAQVVGYSSSKFNLPLPFFSIQTMSEFDDVHSH